MTAQMLRKPTGQRAGASVSIAAQAMDCPRVARSQMDVRVRWKKLPVPLGVFATWSPRANSHTHRQTLLQRR